MVAEQFATMLEKSDVPPWKRTFKRHALPRNLTGDEPYKGFNFVYLMLLDEADPYYVTYNQAKKLGGHVKKGADAKKICFFRNMEFDAKGKLLPQLPRDATPEMVRKRRTIVAKSIPFLQYNNVFNARLDCEGLEDKIPKPEPLPELEPEERHKQALDMIEGFKKDICPMVPVESQPCYYPKRDVVGMPDLDHFRSVGDNSPVDNYAAVCLHEYAHATGHPNRLGRRGVVRESMNSDDAYAFEELVAEFASFLTMSELGLSSPKSEENSTAYLQTWAKKIRKDPKAFVAASFQAVKAHKYLMGIDREKTKPNEKLLGELNELPEVPVKGEMESETPAVQGEEAPVPNAPEVEGAASMPDSKEPEQGLEGRDQESAGQTPTKPTNCQFTPLTPEEIEQRRADFDLAINEIQQEMLEPEVEGTTDPELVEMEM